MHLRFGMIRRVYQRRLSIRCGYGHTVPVTPCRTERKGSNSRLVLDALELLSSRVAALSADPLLRNPPRSPHTGGGSPLKTTTIRLDDELYERLEVIARIEGRPVADAVREAVKEFIEGRFHNEGFIGKAEEMAEQVNQFMRAAREVKKKPQGTNAA